jgi:hypothetical protein
MHAHKPNPAHLRCLPVHRSLQCNRCGMRSSGSDMPEFDIDAFITEVERLGLKLTATRLLDGTYRVNRWRMPDAITNAQQIEDLWAKQSRSALASHSSGPSPCHRKLATSGAISPQSRSWSAYLPRASSIGVRARLRSLMAGWLVGQIAFHLTRCSAPPRNPSLEANSQPRNIQSTPPRSCPQAGMRPRLRRHDSAAPTSSSALACPGQLRRGLERPCADQAEASRGSAATGWRAEGG